jgi:restriction system protein
VEKFFPHLNDADRADPLPSGGSRWTNRIQWARQNLVDRGEMTSAGHGIWAITDKGRARLESEPKSLPDALASHGSTESLPSESLVSLDAAAAATLPVNLEELAENYAAAFERKMVQELMDREPREFEAFASKLMTVYGFQKMKVTNPHTAPDGGIDGNGELKLGLATMRAAFQCKRWRDSVGRPEIDKFRGAIQGQFEHGYFFTTSTFSREARQASIKDGAVPIFLFDGREIVKIMIEKGLGISHRPIEIYEDRLDELFEKE